MVTQLTPPWPVLIRRDQILRRGGGRGHQALDGVDGLGGEPVESGADPGAELIVAFRGHLVGGDRGHGAQRSRQMARDGIEYVLLTCTEHEVRAHAGGGLGHAGGDGLGVPLAAALRLWAGHVPLPVMQRGRPAWMGIARRVDPEPPGGMLITGRVGDDGGAVTIGTGGVWHVPITAGGRPERQPANGPADPRKHWAVVSSPGGILDK